MSNPRKPRHPISTTPDFAIALASAVRDAGGRALIVGGWVRDEMLGRVPKDLDLEVHGLPADRLQALLRTLGRVDAVGESFTVYKIGGIDVSLPRRESKTGRGHKGFTVEGDPFLSIDEAARRRDFTINAMARDPLTGEVLDPFDGQRDLKAGRLRLVDVNSFGDDSLRVLRAMQFAARFDLTIEPATAQTCMAIPLDDLPAERIWGEFEKLLLQAERPSIGLTVAWDLRIIHRLLPEFVALRSCPQDPEWHPEGNVWTHTLMVVDEARQRLEGLSRGAAVSMMLGAMCHDLGKPLTTAERDGHIRSPGHEAAGVSIAASVLDRLNVHTMDGYDVRRAVFGLVAEHMRPSAFMKSPKPAGDGAFRRLAQRVDLDLLARFSDADCHGRGGAFDCSAGAWFLARAKALGIEHAAPDAIVLGRHLLDVGVKPGPRMGEILRALYEQQLDGEFTSVEDGLIRARALIEP